MCGFFPKSFTFAYRKPTIWQLYGRFEIKKRDQNTHFSCKKNIIARVKRKRILFIKSYTQKTKVCQKNQKTSFSEKKISHEKFG